MGKKGYVAGVISLIIIVIIIIVWLIALGQRECHSDRDCGKESYCTSDFTCHKIPVIEKTPVIVNKNYNNVLKSAKFLGIALIIASIIFKFKKERVSTLYKRLFKKDKEQALLTKKSIKRISKNNAKIYLIIGALAGALIVLSIVLIAIILS